MTLGRHSCDSGVGTSWVGSGKGGKTGVTEAEQVAGGGHRWAELTLLAYVQRKPRVFVFDCDKK